MGHYIGLDLPPPLVQTLDVWALEEERPRSALLRLIIRRAVRDWERERREGLKDETHDPDQDHH